ncbi:MAG: acetolactate synthase-1/2/3 large subunit [Rickettsiales bacterium]|jgi:acetolactate synthase-1/2/3 large subunit
MHLVGSFADHFSIIPVVNEVAAGIAVEYFNEAQENKKAFALVTAGPGLTNIVTALAGAYLESRELLVIGGQVKTEDLSLGSLRQKGIQEIDGVKLVNSITKFAIRLDQPVNKETFLDYIEIGGKPRKGPVFIEMPLDVQARQVDEIESSHQNDSNNHQNMDIASEDQINQSIDLIRSAKRPLILIGAGVGRETINKIYNQLDSKNVPIMTTWNAMDRIDANHKLYFGRPNTWGQRYANILIQQSDLLIAVGTRLGMQQTGFNWQGFIPNGKIIQIDCDPTELEKEHPTVDFPICADANDFLIKILQKDLGNHQKWLDFCTETKQLLPVDESHNNKTSNGFISPYKLTSFLSKLCNNNDVIIPCSSGGAFTTMMQIFQQKKGQTIITNKALASMGYGLSGAIGAAISHPNHRTILVEGDGGFAQNSQEIATAVANDLNLKIFLFENSGYASIRMTQKNYFGGNYVGCDVNTGLGFPDWHKLFSAYGVDNMEISDSSFVDDSKFLDLFNNKKCAAFIVRIDPDQTYLPKISSRVTAGGGMESNPLHLMSPDLGEELSKKVFKYL